MSILHPDAPVVIIDDKETCPYDDQRTAQFAYFMFRDPSYFGQYARHDFLAYKFSLLQRGYLSETFAASAPVCPSCNACFPVRVKLEKYGPGKTLAEQIRRHGQNIDVTVMDPAVASQLYPLYDTYKAYMSTRHPSSKMKDYTRITALNLILSRTDILIMTDTVSEKLIGYATIDCHADEAALDAVVFDPAYKKGNMSPGGLLWHFACASTAENGIRTLYVGPANDSPKLSYKLARSPQSLEIFRQGQWTPYLSEKLQPAIPSAT